MNYRALKTNWVMSRQFCRSLTDRFKYITWLYASMMPRAKKIVLQIAFSCAEPIGHVRLDVRCNGGADAFIFSEVFVHRYYDFPLHAAPRTILDLGANVGFTSLFFARKYPEAQLACIEPVPSNLSVLKTNLARNKIRASIFENAVTAANDRVRIALQQADYAHKIIPGIDTEQSGVPGILVDGVTIPSVMHQLKWERISLLKIDIEGYEAVLLTHDADWLDVVDAITIECHDGFGERELADIATRYGFTGPKPYHGTWLLMRD